VARSNAALPEVSGRPKKLTAAGAPKAAQALDRLIHERTRLGIISALAVNESLTFTELKNLLDASDGNVSGHTRRLEDAGYILCTKSFDGRVPRTEFQLTASGRKELKKYLNHMEALIKAMRPE
jgi:DNA-binding MarR family transcriptional regulator